jgi:eukaryotic-like serine/threonine-protein kinase
MSLQPATWGDSAMSERSLEDALEQVVLALESDQPVDREHLLEKFPQWTEELNQFIDNWLAMEQRTSALTVCASRDGSLASMSLNGRILGDYELLEMISNGGMGVVYRARQLSLGRIVALKMVLNAVRDKPRFRMEAEAAASLHHANIVAIHEVGEFEGEPFLSMQYIAGENLQDHLKSGPMQPKAAAILVRTIASAVHYAHQRGILHRDLKPANVLLDGESRPFVTDFGLAKQIGNSVELTRSGAILGTPGYMAPEQAMGQVKSLTVQADVYGLGAILYATLTGNAPFKTDSDLLTLRKVIEEPPISPRSMRPQLDRNLETICLKCLEKSPAARYGSAKQLADDLTRYLAGEPVAARPIGLFEHRWRWCVRNPALAILSVLAGLMLTALVLISLGFGWREYMARMNAEFARIREAAMTEVVDLARIDAESKNQKAQQAVGDLYTTNGLWAARTNLHGEALLWFARAAKLEGLPSSMLADSQTRCLSWLSHCPKPGAALQLSRPLQPSTFQHDWSIWQLSPTRHELILKSGDDFGIWNFDSDEIWKPLDQDLRVSAGSWSRDGESLALGSSSGEIRLLNSLTKATRATAFLDAPIQSIAFSTAGHKIIVSTPNSLAILNSQNLVVACTWPLESPCLSSKFSNDDTLIVVLTGDGNATVYDLREEDPKLVLQVPSYLPMANSFSHLFAPQFSEDGSKLFVRTEEQRLRIFDCSSGEQLGSPIVTGTTYSVALTHDQTHCAAGGDSYARLQSIEWKELVPNFTRHACRLSHDDAVTSLAFGGKSLIATAGRDRMVHLWRVGPAKLPGRLYNDRDTPLSSLAHTDEVVGLLFSTNSSQLVTVQRDGLIRVWQVPSFDPPGYRTQVTKGGTTIKTVARDRWLISGSTHWRSNVVNTSLRRLKDGLVVAETPLNGVRERGHLLDAALTQAQDKLISLHANPARSGATMLAKAETAGSIQAWQFPDGRPLGPRIPLRAEPRAVVLHPSESMAAVLLVNRDVLLVDLADPKIVTSLPTNQNQQSLDMPSGIKPSNLHNGQIRFSRDGQLLFTWGIGKGFYVWDWQDQKPKFSTTFADKWKVRHLAVTPAGYQCAVACDETNRVVLVDCNTGRLIHEYEFTAQIRSLEFSATGRELLVACEDNRARILDIHLPDHKALELVHDKKVLDACFSPDGTSIATLTVDMQVYLWRIRDRQWFLKPMPVPAGTQEIVFSPNSQYILTMSIGDDSDPGDVTQVLDLHPLVDSSGLNVEYASCIGELLSAKSIGEGGIVQLSSAEWLERWRLFQLTFNKR